MATNHDIAAYAGFLNDDQELLACSSGGIATALARQMIRSGGYVAGVSYTDNFMSAEYRITNNEKMIDRFKGSKYIDTYKNTVYSDVKVILERGDRLLFFGTPCIVAALHSYLQREYTNLITVELICHGPTDPKVHRQYIEHLESKHKSKVVDFTVKHKRGKWTPQYLYAKFENGEIFHERFYSTEYGYAFSSMAMPQCYSCQFRGNNRTGDIMLGDFWGATEKDVFWNEKGVSSILVHTTKGNDFLLSTKDISLFPTTFEKILEKNQNIVKPRAKTRTTDKFTKLFENHDLFYSVKHSKPIKNRIKAFIKRLIKQSQ